MIKVIGSICSDLDTVLVGCVYVPTENTTYADQEFSELESEMCNISENRECICLFRDFNAKTDHLQDYVQADASLLYIFNLNDEPDLISCMYDYEYLPRANLPLHRKSTCTSRPS